MLVLYFDWQELEHYLDDFILIITAFLATVSNLEKYNNGYWLWTDCLGIPHQNARSVKPRASIRRWDYSLGANASGCTSDAILKVEKVPRQPAISGKRRSEPSKVGEKDWADPRAKYEPKKNMPGGEKGVKRARGSGRIKKTEMPVFSLIRLLILHLHLHLHSLYLAALFPTHPLHYTIALDSRSEARFVRRHSRGLGI